VKHTQNSHQPQAQVLPPVERATFPNFLSTLEVMDLALPVQSHTLADTCVDKESAKLSHTVKDHLVGGAVCCPVNGYWNLGSEVDRNRIATTSCDFTQNVSNEESKTELVDEEENTPLLSQTWSGATVPFESPYSELLQWLENPELSTEGGVLNDLSVTECHSGNVDGVHTGATDAVQSSSSISDGQADNDHSPKQTYQIPSIVDLAPEWSYPEGGSKVLVIGPWFSRDENYVCLFDDQQVPADLIQRGVLRCCCPGGLLCSC
jgi:hypothetical protein